MASQLMFGTCRIHISPYHRLPSQEEKYSVPFLLLRFFEKEKEKHLHLQIDKSCEQHVPFAGDFDSVRVSSRACWSVGLSVRKIDISNISLGH